MNRRGNWAMSHPVVAFIIGLFAVVIVAGISTLVLDALNTSQDADANASTQDSPSQPIFSDGVNMFANFTNQLGTVGTIGGVLLLLILIAAAGLYGYKVYRAR